MSQGIPGTCIQWQIEPEGRCQARQKGSRNLSVATLNRNPSLLVRAGSILCAIPLSQAVETMRPLDVEPVSGLPEFVLGLSIIRGHPVPVVSLPLLLNQPKSATVARFVTIHVEDRLVALAVSEVTGVSNLENIDLKELPPLVQHATAQVVETI